MTKNQSAPYQHTDPLARLSPHFLEEVDGIDALEWVREQNTQSEGALQDATLEEQLLAILNDPRRIPQATLRGGYAFNFWTDNKNPRGVWRRQREDRYLSGADDWETLIDVDALSESEGKSWVWHGASVRYPQADRALVTLSDGGTDADETREFDLETLTWVDGGFFRPSGKGSLQWIDIDHCWLTQPMGDGTASASGYPLQARLLVRGQRLEDAPVMISADRSDMGVWAGVVRDHLGVRATVTVMHDFFSSTTYVGPAEPRYMSPTAFQPLPAPATSEVSVWNKWTLIWLREDWHRAGKLLKAGSVLGFKTNELLDEPDSALASEVFIPTATRIVEDMKATEELLILTVLDDVVSQLEYAVPSSDSGWESQTVSLPQEVVSRDPYLTIAARPVEAPASNDIWAVTTGYNSPSTLWLLRWKDGSFKWQQIRRAPELYEASGITVSRHFATSADGTRIPYFQVTPKVTLPAKTLLYGYGGFGVSLLPAYAPGVGKAWLETGGVYVVANIRGGGEYGPDWHTSALRENRHLAYEDFVAVARDLVERGVTTQNQLGAQGGSNGGLLIGNMYTRFPGDFGALVCQVPLLDMGRFHTLLAGHSWVAEYGNPEIADDWEFIRTFSPVHLFDPNGDYPPLLLTTSTRDDRVHPGHARSMAHLAESAGKDVLYYENTEGGHAGAADNRQRAHAQALAWTFLQGRLGDTAGSPK